MEGGGREGGKEEGGRGGGDVTARLLATSHHYLRSKHIKPEPTFGLFQCLTTAQGHPFSPPTTAQGHPFSPPTTAQGLHHPSPHPM